ncbi:sensor histidine kinase [Paenibacillus sp. FJAT-27812]|uniref:sensor histidine kinase n=1 Tax=Paenibacillus sp. FJAT-27812 TaxID=1684143 RepID=UPI0006A75F20|nr:HAMP domain-containing sensor histidine kinase [Paenibacillus sp. FJAT-27812]
MKLLYQINIAFAVLLVLVLSLTAVIFHYVLLDHFINVQKMDMKQLSTSISTQLTTSKASAATLYPVEMGTAVSTISKQGLVGMDAVITDASENVVFSTLEAQKIDVSVKPLNDSGIRYENVYQADNSQVLVAASAIPQGGTLTLFAPMSKIKAIEQSLMGRLLIVLCCGGVFAFLLSLVITRKLIKPLMKVQSELKKVESRQFSEVKLVKAGGEIGDVAQSVYELAGEMERYHFIQRQFIQNASHELKTPLMSISGYAEGIRDGIFEGEQVGKGLDIIMSESSRLKNIVTEMTLLAKLDGEEEHFKFTKVSVSELITETIERINPLLTKNDLTITTAISDGLEAKWAIQADRDKLLQALLNVASNATRYASSQIRIHAGIHKTEMEISITDDGAGLPEELIPHLFHRFVKGKDGETGLGLAISRAIVERCGGTIMAQNHDEGGAHVRMRFPLKAA